MPNNDCPHPVIDGLVYGFQPFGGINTLFNEVLPRIAARHAPVTVMVPKKCVGRPPFGRRVRRVPRDCVPEWLPYLGMARPLWQTVSKRMNRWRRDAVLRADRQALFQSTYFTSTQQRPSVGIVYDLNHERMADRFTDSLEWLRTAYRDSLVHVSRVIAISEATKRDTVHYFGLSPDRVDVVPLAISQEVFYPDREISPVVSKARVATGGKPYVLFVGARNVYKNFEGYLKALADPAIRTKMVGIVVGTSEWTAQEAAEIDRLALKSQLQLIIKPSDAELRQLYSGAFAFVFPSRNEGFGLPLLEAMACGAPVVAADTPIFHEVAADAAVYFPPEEPAYLAAALDRLNDSVGREKLRQAGFARIREFSWDRTAEGFWKSYCHAYAGR